MVGEIDMPCCAITRTAGAEQRADGIITEKRQPKHGTGENTMSDYIDRDAALAFEASVAVDSPNDIDLIMRGVKLYMEYIKGIPSTDVEVKEAEWLYDSTSDMFACSACGGLVVLDLYSYCPWCGAKMQKVKGE